MERSPFMRFWAAQNALCAMYGIPDLNWGEARDLWRDLGRA